jgi:SAM-dependent methyltransferase
MIEPESHGLRGSMAESAIHHPYALGHSGRELDRLMAQARIINPITRHFLQEAGLTKGMRVLDVGSGAGDVAFLAADLVGPSGEVIGVDRSLHALKAARPRVQLMGNRNVSFREGDPSEMMFERPFDAVIGRYVLQYQPDPAAMLRKLAAHLRPGGVIVFQESDWSAVKSFPRAPTHDRCCGWIARTMELLGAEMQMGLNLHSIFVSAGLPAPTMELQALIGGGKSGLARARMVVELLDTLSEAAIRLGVATATELDLGLLADRMSEEVIAGGSVLVGNSEIGAWSTYAGP